MFLHYFLLLFLFARGFSELFVFCSGFFSFMYRQLPSAGCVK